MSSRIRGQEATISITVGDDFAEAYGFFGQLTGSFFKVRDFTLTPRTDINEESFLGEKFDDLDIQHHGWDFSFTIDEVDASVTAFMDLIAYKERNSLPPPEVGVQVSYTYRDPNTLPTTDQLIGCYMKLAERTIGGRKEYIQNSFEGKAKDKETLIG